MDRKRGLPVPAGGTATLAADPLGGLEEHDVAIEQIGQWSLVWLRFQRHRLAVWSAAFLGLILLLAIVGPSIAPPAFISKPNAAGIIVTPAALAPSLHSLDWKHLMGTDVFGNPVALYVLAGTRAMLLISVLGSVLALVIGLVVGGVAGYFGGVVDGLLMRLVDAFLTIPLLPLLMTLALYLTNRGAIMYALLFGLTGWAAVARLCRASILSIREREYVEAARALGVSDAGVIVRHLIPNTLDVLIVAATLNVATFILAEASLDFLGVGTSDPTWARGLTSGGDILHLDWWVFLFPSIPMLLTVLAVNFLGDGLRDALDSTSVAGVGTAGATRARRSGPLRRSVAVSIGALRRATPAVPRPSWRGQRVSREGLPQLPRARAVLREAPLMDLPLVTRIVPVVLLFLAGTAAFLYGHSPLQYSPYYAAPVTQISLQDQAEFGAVPLSSGGWGTAFVDGRSRVMFTRTASNGHAAVSQVLDAHGSSTSAPWLATQGTGGLAVWVHGQGETVLAAHVGGGHRGSFVVSGRYRQVEHPYVVARPDGGYDVLFESAHGVQGIDDIYLTTIPSGATAPVRTVQLTHATEYALYPRAVYDGSGALDLIYMNRLQPGLWDWRFVRLDSHGRPRSRPQTLEHVQYYLGGNGALKPDVVPTTWAAGVSRAPDGSVWAAWGGDIGTSVAHWSASGRVLVRPVTVISGTEVPSDSGLRSLALVATAHGGVVYHRLAGEQENYMAAYPFDARGRPASVAGERVAYDGGGDATLPHAGLVNGCPAVLWEKVRLAGAVAESSLSHPYTGPDLLTRLGLNIGPLWQNLAFVLFGALALGIGIATINLVPAVVLALLSLLLRRLVPRFWLWPAYALLVTVVLLLLFARSANPPSFIIVISGLASPYGLIAALGGGVLSWWSGRSFFRHQDDLFRAAYMALSGFAFVAGMYAVTVLEAQIGRI
jgi:peptide/nickel transport system permease protein